MTAGLRVTYLLEDTTLFGGVKVVLHQAELLARRGHAVTVLSRGARPSWWDRAVPFATVSGFSADEIPAADVNVATYWTTIAPAVSLPCGQALHYCQGFEASYTHNQDQHASIRQAYATEIPALAVAPHLVRLLDTQFRRPARLVTPALERRFRPRPRLGPRREARILVAHPFENDWKGVATALQAVRLLREQGRRVRLVRLSQWPLGDAEKKLLPPDEYHHHLPPCDVPRLLAGCDLLLAPSWEQEAFGLPVLEAMACGVPVVATTIEAFSWYAAETALLVPPRDAAALAAAANEVLDDPHRWRQMRRRGLRVARAFSEEIVATAAESALRWAASGAWKSGR